MVIDQIDARGVFAHELEHDPQIPGYRDRPLSFTLTVQGMKPNPGVNPYQQAPGSFKVREDLPNFPHLPGRHTAGVAGSEQPFHPLVRKRIIIHHLGRWRQRSSIDLQRIIQVLPMASQFTNGKQKRAALQRAPHCLGARFHWQNRPFKPQSRPEF